MIAVSFFHHYYRLPKKLNKLSIRGRRQRYSRPKVARLAAASSTIRGRKSMTSIRAYRNPQEMATRRESLEYFLWRLKAFFASGFG